MSNTRTRSRTTIHRTLTGAFACLLLAGASPALAQSADGLKIAVINTDDVVRLSEAGKKAMADIDALRQQKTTEGEAKTQEVVELQKRITEGRLSLSEEKLAELQKEYEDKAIALKRFEDDANRELTKKRNEVLAELDRKIMPVINQLGVEQDYDLIFRKFESGLIFASETVDITDEIIRRVDGGSSAGQ